MGALRRFVSWTNGQVSLIILFKIDNKTGFEKIIYEELRRYYQTMGWPWPNFNPTLNYEFSLFDILGI